MLSYQERPEGPVFRWAPGRRIRHCDCWRTYSYLDKVVLAIADERSRLANANRETRIEIERLRTVLRMQEDIIREFEASIIEEQEQTNAF